MDYYGVIDLGTNTFHLLLAGWDAQGGFREIYRERRFIKLGEAGMDTIGEAPYLRGIKAVRAYWKLLSRYQPKAVRAIGTAALRSATNGPDFIREVEAETGLVVELISGDEEARLIHLGVIQAVPLGEQPQLIMDIGGGSVELILADRREVHWAASFPIGLAVLHRRFHSSDPISDPEVKAMHSFLDRELEPFISKLQQFPVSELIGASGTFEVLEDMLEEKSNDRGYSQFDSRALYPHIEQFRRSTLAERLAIEKLPNSRADMFIVALLLLEYILRKAGIRQVAVSRFALKEGVLYEMMRSYS